MARLFAGLLKENMQRLKRSAFATGDFVIRLLEQGVDPVDIVGKQTIHLLLGDRIIEHPLDHSLSDLWARRVHTGDHTIRDDGGKLGHRRRVLRPPPYPRPGRNSTSATSRRPPSRFSCATTSITRRA